MDVLIRLAAVLGVAVLVTFVAYGVPALAGRVAALVPRRAGSAQTSARDDCLAQDMPGSE